jgi:MFS superfamily sulfate permease-like transporter
LADHHPLAPTGPSTPLTPGFLPNLRPNLIAGFLVFLIAMPLCLAIARASNFPPVAGIWTAVLGGLVCTFLSNSQLTIKGPAAGLIVIVAGAVTDLGAEFGAGLSDADRALVGYKLALGIGIVAGVIQILFGLIKAGRLGDWFPLTPVHGMLASIGIIIIAKQAYTVIGADPPKDAGPLGLLAQLPAGLANLNPEIAAIGLVSLLVLFGLPVVKNPYVRRIPAPLVVLVAGVALGFAFDLHHVHKYPFPDRFFDTEHYRDYEVGPRFLVDVPDVLTEPAAAFALPDFRGVLTPTGLKYVLLFALIGSLESLLSAKAIDLIDPWKRKTDLNRDILAIGVANTAAACIGALPMISEIVRSKANTDNGARTKYANFFHGLFLLAFVLVLPGVIHSIPLAALAAMLVYTGFRLASPREFVNSYRIGKEQFLVFVGTILATLATDLLIGILAGIALELFFHLLHGVPIKGMVWSLVEPVYDDGQRVVLVVRRAAVFSNWLGLKAAIHRVGDGREVVVDLSDTRLVDHSVMEKLHELERELADRGGRLTVAGLDDHRPLSPHPHAARKQARRVAHEPAEVGPGGQTAA